MPTSSASAPTTSRRPCWASPATTSEGEFLAEYLEQQDPRAQPVRDDRRARAWAALVRDAAVERGAGANPELKLGVCGEHGGDPESIDFFEEIGLDYVSCSPFRVPIARVAAAQAAIRHADLGRPRMRVAVVAEYYPRPWDPALGHLGAPAGAGGQRASASRCACSRWSARSRRARDVRALPRLGPLARLGAAVRGPAGADGARRRPGALRALRVSAAPVELRELGPLGRAARCAARSTSCARAGRSTWCTPTTRCRPATRCCAGCGAAATCRWSSRCTVATCPTRRPAASAGVRPSCGCCGRPLRVIANSEVTRRGIEQLTGPLPALEVIHPGADLPEALARPRAGPDPGDRRAPRSPQEPGRRDPRARRAEGPAPGPALRADRQGPGPGGARASSRRALGVARPGRVPRARCRTRRARARWRAAMST